MTRTEAINRIIGICARPQGMMTRESEQATMMIDVLEALGLLKIEVPKEPVTKLALALGWPEGGRSEMELMQALQASGLKVVAA